MRNFGVYNKKGKNAFRTAEKKFHVPARALIHGPSKRRR